eukprot:g13480.t1
MAAEESKVSNTDAGGQREVTAAGGVDREGAAGAGTGTCTGTGTGATSEKENKETEGAASKGSKEEEEEEEEQEEEEEEEELVIEQPLLTIKEVFVYQVPPLRASSGHRAEEWGLANPVFTGFLKAVQVGNACCLRLFKPPPEGELGAVPELFAECPVRLDNGRTLQVYVESVIDSSRYFVLRCEDRASGRHAYVGIGFRERSSAFDLKAVLDDFVRFLDRQKRAEETFAVEEAHGEEDLGPVKPMKDLSIAEGQKVHLDLKLGSNAGSSRARRRPRSGVATKTAGGSGGGGLLLAPPPLPGATYKGAAVAGPGSGSGSASPPTPGGSAAETTPSAVSPKAKATVSSAVGDNDAVPPVATSPASGEPPDEGPKVVDAGVGDKSSNGGAGGGGDGDGGDDDDDGWGEFESA